MNLKTIYAACEALQLPEGGNVRLMPWQRAFLRDILRKDTRIASLSVGRSNGKSLVAAILAWLYLDGPLKRPGNEIIIASSSFDTGKVLFGLVVQWVQGKGFHVQDSNAKAVIRGGGARLQVCGTNARTIHGRPITLALFDEPSQVINREGMALFNALVTGLGKRAGGMMAVTGTKAADRDHWSNRLLRQHADIRVDYSYQGDEPFLQRNYAKANPSIWHLPNLKADLKRAAALARKDSMLAMSFMAYHCNAGTQESERLEGLIEPGQYAALEGDVVPTGPYVLGVDLSSGWAMTGISRVDLEPDGDGIHHADAFAVWPGVPDVAEREKQDSVPVGTYSRMVERDELVVHADRRVVDLDKVVEEAVTRWGVPEVVIGDRYRGRELEQVAERYGLTPDNGGLVLRGQGYRDGGDDVREFMRLAIDRKLMVPRSDLLRRAVAACRTKADDAGNKKIAKEGERGRTGRDDAAVALVVAAAEVGRQNGMPTAHAGPAFIFNPVQI